MTDVKRAKPPVKKGAIKRVIKLLFKTYPWQMALVCICIVLVSFASTIASIFMNKFIVYIEQALKGYRTADTRW